MSSTLTYIISIIALLISIISLFKNIWDGRPRLLFSSCDFSRWFDGKALLFLSINNIGNKDIDIKEISLDFWDREGGKYGHRISTTVNLPVKIPKHSSKDLNWEIFGAGMDFNKVFKITMKIKSTFGNFKKTIRNNFL